jgi:CRISPR-associated endonuclease/helicase Cas3
METTDMVGPATTSGWVTVFQLEANRYQPFFRDLTGFDPLPFQTTIAEQMLAGRNLVITAPTGSGKTWAVVAPYLFALAQGRPITDRLLYALPMRSLASALYESLRNRLLEYPIDRLAAATDIRMQSGTAKEDPFFRGRITFTTLDQLLSGYLTVPVSLGDRLGNINAGALVGASVIFDELHLLEPSQALGTAIEMGQRLGPLTQIVMMTATLPQECVELLCDTLNAVHVAFGPADLDRAPHLRDRHRQWTWIDRPLTVEDVIEHHTGRSLVICNSVARAQQIYQELVDRVGASSTTRCVLLHSRFLPPDRAAREAEAAPGFVRDAAETDIIAVTTQVVEAGMDWGADTLHTELAPANALVQRAGRTARFPAPRNRGRVFVYDLLRTDQGARAVGPYRSADGRPDPANDATYRAIAEYRDTMLSADNERALVECVHKEADLAVLRTVANNLGQRAAMVQSELFDAGERARLSELVRDADSVNVIVSATPERLELERGPESVSVARPSLGALREVFSADPTEWKAKQPTIEEDGTVTWTEITSFSGVMRAPWYIALSPSVASYSPERGLVLGTAGAPMPVRYAPREPRLYGQYKIERWTDHALRVAQQATLARRDWQRAADRLDEHYGLPRGTAAELLRIACLLHDFGKLSKWWQDVMQGWQRTKDADALASLQGAAIAHTDFDPRADRERQRREFRQPSHAMEGAYAAADAIWTAIARTPTSEDNQQGAARCVATAIARHHGPRTRTIGKFAWVQQYAREVDEVLGEAGACGGPRSYAENDAKAANFCATAILRAADPDDARWLPLYWFLVRNLRLADQASQAAR